MKIPVATSTIRILRVPADPARDPLDVQPAPSVVASGINAQISLSRGRQPSPSGSQEIVEWRMSCDPADVQANDIIEDTVTGESFTVLWARQRVGFGLDHTQAGLVQRDGAVSP